MLLEKTLENPLDYKEIQPVHFEGDQPWDFFGRNDAKAETPVPGHLPDPEIESMSPVLAGRFFTSEPPEKLHIQNIGL